MHEGGPWTTVLTADRSPLIDDCSVAAHHVYRRLSTNNRQPSRHRVQRQSYQLVRVRNTRCDTEDKNRGREVDRGEVEDSRGAEGCRGTRILERHDSHGSLQQGQGRLFDSRRYET